MSRTYRAAILPIECDCNCGAPIWTSWGKSEDDMIARSIRLGLVPDRTCDCDTWYYDNHKRNYKRDRKDYNKADKGYKTVKKKIRKAKERSAMTRGDYENIPTFRRSNDYDIN